MELQQIRDMSTAIRDEAKSLDALGVALVVQDANSATNGESIDLCIDCAEARNCTLRSNIFFIYRDNYARNIQCVDCGCLIACESNQ